MFQPSPSRQAHKLAIVNLVLTKKPGDLVTKEEISAATKAREQEWKSSIEPAKKALRKERGWLLHFEHSSMSYRVALDSDVAGMIDGHLRRARNQAKRACEKASVIDGDRLKALSADEQGQFLQQRARALILRDVTEPKKLRDLAVVNRKELPSIAGLE